MIIGIDGNEANVARRVGIGEYAYKLLKQFSNDQRSVSTTQFQIYLKDAPQADMPKSSKNWQYIMVKPRKLWTQIGLPIYLFTHFPRPDVFFTPSHYAPRFSPVPTVISVMDVSYLHFPELFAKHDLYQLTAWTKYSVHNAKKVFTISESSKNDIIKYYHKKAEDVIVTHLGIKSESTHMNQELSIGDLSKKFNIPQKYVLFVGTIQPRKNIARLIDAFAKVITKHPDVGLVIVGKKGWLYEPILAEPEKIGIQDHVHFLDFVSNEELSVLYHHAICYCLPSLYEGFGLPVLEAMQQECPVITSNISSLPEAGGDACLYVNPEDVADIAKKIIDLIENPALRKQLIAKGLQHSKKFSWEKTAKETLEVLQSLITKK
jgi:glycosyltransferase involved in cell wall biosynthesis